MKRTLTANISGQVFHIEEDAYEKLNAYLSGIRRQFTGSAGQEEIMADIEARIAELFQQRMDGRRQVVNMGDVEHVIGVLGQPEDIGGEEGPAAAGSPPPPRGGKTYRRLFRDPNDRWLGGVISGLAAYFGTDPLWWRVAFIMVVVFGWGTPMLVYILMWILVPPASSPAERLMMEGEPVTVDNLKKAFEEGGQRVAKEAEDLGRRWNRPEYREQVRSGARQAMDGFGRAMAKIIGLFLLLIGIALSLGIITTAVGGSVLALDGFDGPSGGLFELAGMVFNTPGHALWTVIALAVLVLVPVLGLLLAGLQLLFELRSPRWLGWVMLPLWIIAIAVLFFTGARLGNDMKRGEPVRETIDLATPPSGLLDMATLGAPGERRHWSFHYDRGRMDWSFEGLVTVDDSVQGAWAELDIVRSPDAGYHLVVERRARGRDPRRAAQRADNITYAMDRTDSTLALSPWLRFPKEDKFRVQRLRYVLQVPEGGRVRLSHDLGFMLGSVPMASGHSRKAMPGGTWTMSGGVLRPAQGTPAPQEDGWKTKDDREARTRWKRSRWTWRSDHTNVDADMRNGLMPRLLPILLHRVR